MPTRNLGKTGYKVGIFSLGGQAALEKANNFDVAVPIIERALDLGVNYIDTSSIYGGPERWSEQYVGRVMKTRRNDAFLATKTKERTRDGSLRMIEKSLQLLNTDHVDLWQLHDVGLPEDVDAIFAKGGAMEALIEMQNQKVVRFLGVTGHYRPEALIDAVNRYNFDTILMAMNAADTHIHSFTDKLLPLVVEKQMGIIGMKVPSRGRLLASWTPPSLDAQRHSWEGSAIATRPGVMTMQRRDALHAHPSRQHGHHRLRQHRPARRKRQDRPRLHAALQRTDGGAQRTRRPRSQQSLFFRFTDRSKG